MDGVSPNMDIARRTLNRIVSLAEEQPLVYLPSHDPESATRLRQQSVLKAEVQNVDDIAQVPIS